MPSKLHISTEISTLLNKPTQSVIRAKMEYFYKQYSHDSKALLRKDGTTNHHHTQYNLAMQFNNQLKDTFLNELHSILDSSQYKPLLAEEDSQTNYSKILEHYSIIDPLTITNSTSKQQALIIIDACEYDKINHLIETNSDMTKHIYITNWSTQFNALPTPLITLPQPHSMLTPLEEFKLTTPHDSSKSNLTSSTSSKRNVSAFFLLLCSCCSRKKISPPTHPEPNALN